MKVRPAIFRIGLVAVLGPVLCSAAVLPGNAAQPDRASHHVARPVIDSDYLYRQLYDMSSDYVYRASGMDGPPQDPSAPSNLPANVNGWQEFYAHWKRQMTSSKVMGPM